MLSNNITFIFTTLTIFIFTQIGATADTVQYIIESGELNELESSASQDASELTKSNGNGVSTRGTEISLQVLEMFSNAKPAQGPGGILEEYDTTAFVPFGIVGDDDRENVNPTTEFPATAVVHLLYETDRGPNVCSGAMISHDTVLTAGHCVYYYGWHKNYKVYPGRNGGQYFTEPCGVRQVLTLKGWATGKVSEYDMAALKLDCNVGNLTGIFGVRSLDDSEGSHPTTVQGYPGELAIRGRQYRSQDEIRNILPLKIQYENDTTGGMSGSPVFSDDFLIFTVHTGTHKHEDWTPENQLGVINHGTRITPERLKIIKGWTNLP